MNSHNYLANLKIKKSLFFNIQIYFQNKKKNSWNKENTIKKCFIAKKISALLPNKQQYGYF